MSDSLPPLDDELRALLSAESKRPPVAPQTRARVLSRVESSLAIGAGAAVSASLLAGMGKGGQKAWMVGLAFVLGGGIGAGVTWVAKGASERAPDERVVERRVEVLVPGPTVTVTVFVPASVSVAPTAPTAAGAPASVSPPTASNTSGADERNLIDAMRTALKAGDSAGALGFVSAHEKRFPTGAFVEEREAYAVQALARSGRLADAKARGDRFRTRYPQSLLLPVVDQATHP